MNSYNINAEDLDNMLAVIKYMHHKIREGSEILGENLDLISEDMMAELEQFLDFNTCAIQTKQ